MKTRLHALLAASCLLALLLPAGGMAADMGTMAQQGMGMMQTADGAHLLMHITKTDPYVKWDLMPGTTRMRQGQEPHGALQNVYVNKAAMKAFKDKAGALPDGGIIVKENYTPDGKLAAVTVMSKKKGYNPEAGDYMWLKYTPDLKIQAQGKAEACIKCHAQAKDNDWVILAPLKKGK